jgi:dihydropteroate synthase
VAPRVLQLPRGPLPLDHVLVMGILNTTPDSFYDCGRYRDLDAAIARGIEMAAEGAEIIDVGGEKAGPGEHVSVEEEIRRVVPVVTALKRELALPISVDTFKPEVARAAVAAGADIVNSIGGFEDPAMRRACAASGAAAVIMHIQGEPRVARPNPVYGDVVREVRDFLHERAGECIADGIPADRIIIDPGPGFGKSTDHDLAILRDLQELTALPYPVLLAVSRKPFIGTVLGLDAGDRLEGSLAVTTWGVLRGVGIVRAHDIRATVRVCRMTEAVLDPERVKVDA